MKDIQFISINIVRYCIGTTFLVLNLKVLEQDLNNRKKQENMYFLCCTKMHSMYKHKVQT